MTDRFTPFAHSIGSPGAKIAFVGEAWGENEERRGRPLVGHTGIELARMLYENGMLQHPLPPGYINDLTMWMYWENTKFFFTNVLAMRPNNNKMEAVQAKKADAGTGGGLPPMKQGAYLKEEFIPHLNRLYEELLAIRPNLVVAMGNTALWALTGTSKIGAMRGAVTLINPVLPSYKEALASIKVLPTYHPAGIFRNWSWRPIVKADLLKANHEKDFPELKRPERFVLVSPTLGEVCSWVDETLGAKRPPLLGIDIETATRQITMIGFARSRSEAMVVPFWDMTKPGGSYWSREDEIFVRKFPLARLISSTIPKLFQNGLYDLQYIWREGWRPRACEHDSMLLHHSMFPEMPKGLGFLGSIYSNEASWKLMARHGDEMTKRDE